jgi:hypothetical protein
MEMLIHVLGRKDDLKKMEQVAKDLKRICTEVSVPAEIKLTHNFSEIPGQSFNPGATPIIFINQQVEFTGVTDPKLLKSKIIQIRNMG